MTVELRVDNSVVTDSDQNVSGTGEVGSTRVSDEDVDAVQVGVTDENGTKTTFSTPSAVPRRTRVISDTH